MLFDSSDDESLDTDARIKTTKAEDGNNIVHYPSLVKAIQAIGCCRCCVNNDLESFFRYCDEKKEVIYSDALNKREKLNYLQANVNVREWHEEWKDKHENGTKEAVVIVDNTTFGVATEINVICNSCKETLGNIKPNKTRLYKNTNSDLCQYDINILLSFALQLMGVGGQHAAILAAFLNLSEATKWNRQFHVLENFTYDVIQKVKNSSQDKAVQEEVSETVNENNNPIDQHLLVQELPLHRIQASYDMGWQVRSSGGKYGFATGHGLLVGALTKKVLDSVVYNKKCACVQSIWHRLALTKM
jgi:hypothetical protein